MVSSRTRPEPWYRLTLGRAGVRRQSRIVAADAEIASAGRLLNHSDIHIGEVCDMDGGPVLVTRANEDQGAVGVAWCVGDLAGNTGPVAIDDARLDG